MRVGVPKEIKVHEYRVGMIPSGVRELVDAGHEVFVQHDAGVGVGFSDATYEAAGAKISESAEDVFDRADLIIKVKEPQLAECKYLRADQTLFTYLHLAAAPELVHALLKSGVTAIAYETVTSLDGSLPLLTPMSEVAGRMSVQVGAMCLQKAFGGSGVLLGGVPGEGCRTRWRRGREPRRGNGCRPDGGCHGCRPIHQAIAGACRDLRI